MYMIHPLHLLSAVFQLSVLLAIVPPISASPSGNAVLQPTIAPNVGAWYLLGCFSESIHKNTLTTSVSVKGGENHNTVERCTEKCKLEGYGMAGMAAGRECYCGSSIENGGETIPSENCMSACSGDSSQACGGTNSILVYYTD